MNINTVLDLLRNGYTVSREAWDNAEFYLYYDQEKGRLMMHRDDRPPVEYRLKWSDIIECDWYLVC